MFDSYKEIKLAYRKDESKEVGVYCFCAGGGDLSAPDFVEYISIYSATVNSIIASVVF
jgi:hypothetical protein